MDQEHMQRSDFAFDLPKELIAQHPLDRRDSSRLLCLDRETGEVRHRHFSDLPELLRPGDVLVMNDSRVMPSRLLGRKEGTGGAVELLLLNQKENGLWETLVKPGKRAKPGTRVVFGEGLLTGEITDTVNGGNRLVRFFFEGDSFFQVLDQIGRMPLPPYITEELEDGERYQTVYSRELGSAAAPTAGLHFTPELLETLGKKGIETGFVTLHVGLGTFRPVKADDITDHQMHSELYTIPEETARMVTRAKQEGRRVIAVGTTSCRTLESAWKNGCLLRGYQHLHLSKLPIPGAGRADHQLPPAGKHPDHAGKRFRRVRAHHERLPGGSPGAVPVLFLWGFLPYPVALLKIPSDLLLVTPVLLSELLPAPPFLRQDDPVGRGLEHGQQAKKHQGLCQQDTPQKQDEICQVHGVAGKAVQALPVHAIGGRGCKMDDRCRQQEKPGQVHGQPGKKQRRRLGSDPGNKDTENDARCRQLIDPVSQFFPAIQGREVSRPGDGVLAPGGKEREAYQKKGD